MYLNKPVVTAPVIFHDDSREVVTTAYSISGPLHYILGTKQCTAMRMSTPCKMCISASRLVLQATAHKIATELLNRIHHELGYRCSGPHFGDD